MRGRPVIGVVLALISVPVLVALFEAVSFYVENRNNGSIVSSGDRREYLLYVPSSHDPSRPEPLVISMHGGGGWPAMQRDLSGWNGLAERHGFIVAYPAGLEVAGMRMWSVGSGQELEKDVRFISDLIVKLEKAYNIDPARIFANGLSNGGAMAFVLSCKLSDRIAAVGMVAAAQTLPWSWCTDECPVPMISFHGTDDSIVPYEGGTSWVWHGSFPGVEGWAASWARRNGCGPDAVESSVAADVTRRAYTGCADDAAVELFTIHGGGHTWPGGMKLPEWFVGTTSGGVNATREMWRFFEGRK